MYVGTVPYLNTYTSPVISDISIFMESMSESPFSGHFKIKSKAGKIAVP